MTDGPLLALTLRARRTLLLAATALGMAAAGGVVGQGAMRTAGNAHLELSIDNWGLDTLLGWEPEVPPGPPAPEPPTAIVDLPRRYSD